MTIEIDSLRLRLENIQRKCAKLLEKEHSYYSCDFANYLADFVANYLAKIGELFGIIDTRSIK